MTIRHLLITATCVATLGLGACSSNPSNSQIGTGAGAVIGGVAGNAVLGGTLGTVGGAAAGALIGNKIGEDRDRNQQGR